MKHFYVFSRKFSNIVTEEEAAKIIRAADSQALRLSAFDDPLVRYLLKKPVHLFGLL